MSTHQHDASPRPYNLQEDDELTQECKDFISSLPTEDSLCQYNGFWIPTRFMQGVLAFQKHFQAHDTDVLFATCPKVGTTWLKAILFTLVNRMHRYIDFQEHPLLTNNPHVLLSYVDLILYNKKEVPNLIPFTSPRLFSPHLSYVLLPTSVKDSTCKIVYLCRNPKDTFVSLRHFQTKLAEFLGCSFSPEEDAKGVVNNISRLCSSKNLSNLEVNKSGVCRRGVKYAAFFHRGEVEGWVNYFTPQLVEKLDRTIKEKFHSIGLKF
ncbi:hypothetical protein I3842_05G047400 [Carya illinoinensis]|uniref:Sulfotransferase n=1 Tax=Carya illinoinensis TaxID=32201 RepID=A0A922EXB2_CARIL|nr:hypothetical protein I3842_05G047400 [Carya illinoinensis]